MSMKQDIETENPLDVLSRAATMVEKSAENVSPSIRSNAQVTSPTMILTKTKGCERSPSFKERHPKFRKSATPDYMVALDAARQQKRLTALNQSENNHQESDRMDTTGSPPREEESTISTELPLDMSIKKRPASPPPPPPYRFNPLLRQCSPPLSNSDPSPQPPPHFYKAPPPYPATPSPPVANPLPPPPSYEDSTVKCTYPSPANRDVVVEEKTKIKEITIITNSSSDPLLDEHFRRSLGANYETLFKKKVDEAGSEESSQSSSAESTPPKVPQLKSKPSDNVEAAAEEEDPTKVPDPVKAFREDMNMEGYTVEDHFAKALGDTWVKLQKAEEEKRSKTQLNNNQNKSDNSSTAEQPTTLVASS